MYANVNNPANYQLAMLGQFGFRKIDSTFAPVANEYYRIVEVISATADVTVVSEAGDDLTAETLVQGTKIYGLFSSVSVAAGGIVIAYIA